MSDLDFIIKNNLVIGGDATISGRSLSLSLANISSSAPISISDTDSVIDISSKSQMRSAKYSIQVFSGNDYQVSKILVVQDGYNSVMTEYGVLITNGLPLATFSTDISNGDVRLIARLNSSGGTGMVYFSKISMDTVQSEATANQPDPGVVFGIVVGDRFGRANGNRLGETIKMRGEA